MNGREKYFYQFGAYRLIPNQPMLLCDSEPTTSTDFTTLHWPPPNGPVVYEIVLSDRHSLILHALCEEPTHRLSMKNLMRVLWGHDSKENMPSLYNYMSKLNRLLTENDPQKREYIAARTGGYYFKETVNKLPLEQTKEQRNAEKFYRFGKNGFDIFTKEDELTTAKNCFMQAYEYDAEHAAARAAAAETYIWLIIFSWRDPNYALPKAMKLAKEALEKNSNLGDAHAAYALAILFGERAWDEAEYEFKQAINLESEMGYRGYALWLMANEKHRDALIMIEHALDLDESFLNIAVKLMVLYEGGDYGDLFKYATGVSKRLSHLRVDAALYLLGLYYERLGQLDQAIDTIRSAEIDENKFLGRLVLGYLYALAGQRNEALPLLDELKELSAKSKKWVSPFHIALIEEALGNRDGAIEWIDKAIETRDPWALLLIDPRLERVREDPRFQDLVEKTGIG